VRNYTIRPEEFGLPRASLAEIQGGATPVAAAEQLRSVLAGEDGPRLDMVLFNAAAALMAAGKVADLKTGIELARNVISSGAATAKLEALVAFCKQMKRRNLNL
jgi:anthranilate phosphoribosyltransferase